MAFKIELKSTVIPFTVGGFDFEVDSSDENMKAFNVKYTELLTETNKIRASLSADEEQYRALVESSMNELLGVGAFDRLYEKFPSTIMLFDTLNKIVNSLMKSMVTRTTVTDMLESKEKEAKKSSLKIFNGRK